MGRLSEREDAWQAEATAEAVAGARAIAQSQAANTPAGRLSDQQWGWIVSAAIFAWIQTRYRQAVAEGLAQEEHVTRMDPSPRDSALALSILPALADQSAIDWSKPLAAWTAPGPCTSSAARALSTSPLASPTKHALHQR